MASHQFAIAKASFSAGLLRPDPTSLTREEIEHFHSLLDSAVVQCTRANVQKCKHWILENIIQSTGRFTALGKYLRALSTSFAATRSRSDPAAKRDPSIKRKRLHLLYLLNDSLYHAKYRAGDASVCGKLQPILVDLLRSAASFTNSPKHHRKILELLDLWEENGYYSRDYTNKLRETVKNAAEVGDHVEGVGSSGGGPEGPSMKVSKSTPYVMPALHGDPSTPWFDLPAANLMPHIVPNSTRPINPDMIKPLQFVAGPADETLVAAVKVLLEDVQKIFDGETEPDEKSSWDIDELGQPIILDEITGDIIEGEGYYGWSRSFCERMKRRRKGLDTPDDDNDRVGTSRSRSSSRGRKRRRHGGSGGSSSAGHRASRRRSAYSSSRSPSADVRRDLRIGRSRSSSRDRSYSRSRSPDNTRPVDARSLQPPPDRHEAFQPNLPAPFIPPVQFQNGFNNHYPPPPPPPHAPFNGPGQQQYGSWPPPPPPPFQNVPWPPPPPPPPTHPNYHQQAQAGFPPPPSAPGAWSPQGQQGNGRGFGNGWNHSRGGRGGHRGRGWS